MKLYVFHFLQRLWNHLLGNEVEQDNNNENEPYSKCWPRDWLPKDCPGVRVIALNYTTDPYLWRPLWVTKRNRLATRTVVDNKLQTGVARCIISRFDIKIREEFLQSKHPGSLVCIVKGQQLKDGGAVCGRGSSCLPRSTQTGFEPHTASYQIHTLASFISI